MNVNEDNHNVHSLGLAMNHVLKLPAIKLPTFNGKVNTWVEFKETFKTLVDGNKSLSNIQRFHYLRNSLDSDALDIIKSIEVSGNNYELAWQTLSDRFENKRLIVFSHIKEILEYPQITRESHIELRKLFDSIVKNLKSLKNIGINTDEWDQIILYIVSTKLDNRSRRDWENFEYDHELPNMDDLKRFLKTKCEVLEKLDATKLQNDKSKNTYHKKQSNSFASTSDSSRSCYYCKNQHSIYHCEAFLNLPISDRITAVKNLKLCLICLKDNHLSWKCKAAKCSKCRKNHNSLLLLNFNNNAAPMGSNLANSTSNGATAGGSSSAAVATTGTLSMENSTVSTMTVENTLVTSQKVPDQVTKRNILAKLSQIYDPLGLLSPIIIKGKLIIQQLWVHGFNWDTPVPKELKQMWLEFVKSLSVIEQISFSRQCIFSQSVRIELHGFCDSSIQAYGRCIYVRCIFQSGEIRYNLLCAKSRVAPLKSVSLPRLELCGAVLLANLMHRVQASINVKFSALYYWTDSTITLAWLKAAPSKWKTFVKNRVGEIQSLSKIANWRHVKSGDNPADVLPRGTSAELLKENKLWVFGPPWLQLDNSQWDSTEIPEVVEVLEKKATFACINFEKPEILDVLERFSNLNKIIHIVAYINRFANNINALKSKLTGVLTPIEIDNALNTLIRLTQI
nr:unnamed protein product [Callosobruchus analis]